MVDYENCFNIVNFTTPKVGGEGATYVIGHWDFRRAELGVVGAAAGFVDQAAASASGTATHAQHMPQRQTSPCQTQRTLGGHIGHK